MHEGRNRFTAATVDLHCFALQKQLWPFCEQIVPQPKQQVCDVKLHTKKALTGPLRTAGRQSGFPSGFASTSVCPFGGGTSIETVLSLPNKISSPPLYNNRVLRDCRGQ